MVENATPGSRTGARFFLLLLILSGISHFVLIDYSTRHPRVRYTLDSREYLWAAHNLRQESVLYAGFPSKKRNPALYTRRPPAYPSLIALALFFWDDVRAVILVQASLGLFSGYLLWRLVGFAGVSGPFRLAAVAAFLFYPAQMIYTQAIMAATLLQMLVLLSVFYLAIFVKSGKSRYLWLMNASLSLALLTKPILVFFWLPNLVFHIWLGMKHRRVAVLLAALLPLLVQSAWSYRNYRQTGSFQFSSMTTQVQGYLMKKLAKRSEQMGSSTSLRRQGGKEPSAESQRPRLPFYRVVLENPLYFARRQLKGTVTFFLDPGRYDLHHFFVNRYPSGGFARSMKSWESALRAARRARPWMAYLIVIGLFNLLIAAAFVLFPFQPLRGELKVFVFLVVIYMAVMTSAYGRSRYRLPVMPQLLLGAAVVLDRRRKKFGQAQSSPETVK